MNKRKTIIDVARECGLSQATVARVLNGQQDIQVKEKTRQRVMSAAQKIGYRRNTLAANFRRQQSNTIAISIPDITNPFFPELIKGIQEKMRDEGYSVIQLNNEWNPNIEQDHFQYMVQTCVDGAIISPSHSGTDFSTLEGIPFVLLTNSDLYSEYDTVGNNSKAGMRIALEHLYSLGHRKIALLVGGSMRSSPSWRYDLFSEFYREKGLTVPANFLVTCDYSVNSTLSFLQARKSMEVFLNENPLPTAFFASNDILGLAALQVANEKGIKVPEQLSVIGMDGIFSGEVSYPALSTVKKNRSEIGGISAQILLDKIKKPKDWSIKKVLLPCKLIERGSSGTV